MKKRMRYAVLALFAAATLSCHLDGWGWLYSSDVDDRFRDSQAMAPVGLPAPLTPPFSFLVIADAHVLSGTDTASLFSRLAAAISASGDSFVLACGDLVQDGERADYQTYTAQTAGLGVPVFSVPGNHDLFNGGWANYRDLLGRSAYSFSTGAGPGSLRVIAIDSANGTLGAPERAWLEGELSSRAEQFCVTFTHFQFFTDTITETQAWTDLGEAYSLMHLFERSHVAIHFSGHLHRYLERTINGTAYCTVPSLGAGFVRVTVTASGISFQVLPPFS